MKISRRHMKRSIPFALFLILLLLPFTKCMAASATINLSTNSNTAEVGDEITVSLSISADAAIGDFEAYITYNADILEFISEASFIAGGDGLLKLTDKNTANQDTSRKYIMKFKAKAIGISEIAIKDKAEVYELDSGLSMSVSSNSVDIDVSPAKTASDNTYLKNLKISPGKLSPDFDKNKTEYTTEVSYDQDKLIVSAQPEDEKSNIAVVGNEKLIVGNNKISIKVTAESGGAKEYVITAVRKEEEKQQTEEINETSETDLSGGNTGNGITEGTAKIGKVQIKKEGNDSYIQNGFRYRLLEPGDGVAIPDGYIKTSLIINDIPVTAYTLSSDLDNDFLLLYAENENKEAGFYQYDRKEETLQRYVKSREGNKVVMSGEFLKSEEYKAKLTTMGIVLAVLGSVCIILSVAFIRIYLKRKEDKE